MRDAAHDIWAVLGIAPTNVERDIKRAYAKLLKSVHPEDDPRGFQRLRDAYEQAVRHSQSPPEPLPALTPRDSMGIAECLWDEIIARGPLQGHLVRKLESLLTGDTLVDLETRACFEFVILRHCANSSTPESLRNLLVEFFNWDESVAHLLRYDEQIVHMAMGRYRADQIHLQLLKRESFDPAIRALLSKTHPPYDLHHWDRGFAHAMRDLLATIRWQWPELEQYRLDPAVVNWWAARVERKRYFLQTARDSAIGGVFLYLLLLWMLPSMEAPARAVCFGLSIAGVFALVGWWVVKQPAHAWYDDIRQRHIAPLLHTVRYRPLVQYGWLVPLLSLSLLLFLPAPPQWLGAAIELALALTLAVGMFAASAQYHVYAQLVLLLPAFVIGSALHHNGFEQASLLGCIFSAAGAILLAVRGSAGLFALYPALPMKLVRLCWIGGAATLTLAVPAQAMPQTWLAPAVGAWTMLGLTLVELRWQVEYGIALIALFIFSAFIKAQQGPQIIFHDALGMMLYAMAGTFLALLLHMNDLRNTLMNTKNHV